MGTYSTRLIGLLVITGIVSLFYLLGSKLTGKHVKETHRQLTDCLEYSPAYPSAGGAGCSQKCISDGIKKNSTYVSMYHKGTTKWPKELENNMHHAGEILKAYGPLRSLDTESSTYLHVSMDYFCCYNPEEGVRIGDFLNSYEWEPKRVSFDRLVCAIHSTGGLVSLVLMLNEESQIKMLEYILNVEAELEHTTGIKKHIPHTKLQGFHMTLATVNQSLFPVQPAVDEINRTIPPGTWHVEPVVLYKPECKKCARKSIEYQ